MFGWTIDYVLSMTCPRFRYVSARLDELISCKARDEVFLGVVAAIGSNKVREVLFDSCGSFFLHDDDRQNTNAVPYTKEDLEVARKRMREITNAKNQEGKVENHV